MKGYDTMTTITIGTARAIMHRADMSASATWTTKHLLREAYHRGDDDPREWALSVAAHDAALARRSAVSRILSRRGFQVTERDGDFNTLVCEWQAS